MRWPGGRSPFVAWKAPRAAAEASPPLTRGVGSKAYVTGCLSGAPVKGGAKLWMRKTVLVVGRAMAGGDSDLRAVCTVAAAAVGFGRCF